MTTVSKRDLDTRRYGGTSANTLIVMVKEPRLGRVKSRLAREIGEVAATYFYRTLLKATIARLSSQRWCLRLAVAPRSGIASPLLPPFPSRCLQSDGDLGRRMGRLLHDAGRSGAIIIGSDIPSITPEVVAEAFRRLRRCDVVFGPATDGGFWLVGTCNPCLTRRMFDGVRWSSAHALSDTIGNLKNARVGYVATMSDADVAADLSNRATHFGRRIISAA